MPIPDVADSGVGTDKSPTCIAIVPRSAKLGRSKGGNTQQQVSTAMAIPDADAGSSGVVMASGRYLRKRSIPAVRLRSVPSTRIQRHVPMPGAYAAQRSCGRSWAALSRQRNRGRWHGGAIYISKRPACSLHGVLRDATCRK